MILTLAAIARATRQPLIFASIGPTVYELVELPQVRSAKAYNVIVGHFIGLGAGFLAVYLLNAWSSPNVLSTGVVTAERMWSVALAATLTTLATLRAGQPASRPR